MRDHWQVENRVHYVRDFSYDEDRCRASVRNLPRNLAALSNAAISIVRMRGEFKYIPPANRHCRTPAGRPRRHPGRRTALSGPFPKARGAPLGRAAAPRCPRTAIRRE